MNKSTFNPRNVNEFDKSNLNKAANGIFFTATAGQQTTNDFTLSDDILLTGGGVLLVKGAVWGDTINFQVVHPVVGVVGQYLFNWPINPDSTLQYLPPSNYPAKLSAGLILRAIYISTGETDVKIAIGYNMEKIIV